MKALPVLIALAFLAAPAGVFLVAPAGAAENAPRLSGMQALGSAVVAGDAQALASLRAQAEGGDAATQLYLADLLERVRQDHDEAFKWYLRAAEQGNARAESAAASMYLTGTGVAKDSARALEWYGKAAKQGDVHAQILLGLMYEKGETVKQDYTEAAKWLRLAAQQGNPEAQKQIGVLYGLGTGVPRDYSEADFWLALAAASSNDGAAAARDAIEKRLTAAQLAVVKKRLQAWNPSRPGPAPAEAPVAAATEPAAPNPPQIAPETVPQAIPQMAPPAAAAPGLQVRAAQGDKAAEVLLGNNYSLGLAGFSQDEAAALKWYRRAAEQGSYEARFKLGAMYENGNGMKQDKVQAFVWYSLASRLDSDNPRAAGAAATAAAAVSRGMTPAQVAAARRLVDEWPTAADPVKP